MFVTDSHYSEMNGEQLEKPTVTERKAEQFRVQIRRSQIQKIFRSTRQHQMKWLHSLKFLQQICADRNNLTLTLKDKIDELVKGLQSGQQNVNFYQRIGDMHLENYLCQLSVNEEVESEHREMVLYSLVELTYFCSNSLRVILKQPKYVEDLVAHLDKISPDQIQLFKRVIELFVNLSSEDNKQVSCLLIQSDFFKKVQFYLSTLPTNDQTTHSEAQKIRINILNIYNNIFNYQTNRQLAIKLIYMLLEDAQNHQYSYKMLKCLKNMSRIPYIWEQIGMNHYRLYTQITMMVEGFVICLGVESDECFEAYVEFLNQFLRNGGKDMEQILSMNDWKLYMKKFMEMYQDRTPQNRIILLKCIQLMSRGLESNTIPIHHQLFKVLLDPQLAQHPQYGRYCLRLLHHLLCWSPQHLQQMMDYNIFDILHQILSRSRTSSTVDCLHLLQKIIQIKLNASYNKDHVNIIEIVQARGYVKLIEDLQESSDEEVCEQAICFMDWLAKVDV